MSNKLKIIVCSTRPGRVGLLIGEWFFQRAVANGRFNPDIVDLAKVNLPIFDEPKHPAMQKYEHDHTKKWAAIVNDGDAYVFVTPEYNGGPPPALLNALNYVYKEWNYKPAAFVSYGGVAGGTRAVQVEKQILTTLKVVPIFEAVVFPMVAQNISEGKLGGSELQDQAATTLLNELFRWSKALEVLRN